MTMTVAHSSSWQLTDNKADSDPDLDGEALASGPVEGDLASEVVDLVEQATSQD